MGGHDHAKYAPSSEPDSAINNITIQQQFSGPLPAPAVLEQYDKLHPGLAERIVVMAEEEGKHRRQMESRGLDGDLKALKWFNLEIILGQVFGFVIAISTVVSGVYLAIDGKELAGSFIGTGGVIALAAVFVYGRKRK